ncbi:MAG: GNAT family N-acetyltransferase [Desulfobacterales bacterium]|nr:GNAT family N-acetyltransferase [Desulfobacterales bacterium]
MDFRPLTPGNWNDFETLFGPHGAYGGCWCMWWRLTRKVFERQQGDGNRRAMRAIVASGRVPGILGYRDGRPAAWCSVAPREDFPSLNRSPVLKRLDDQPVWSLVCFYIARDCRRTGLMRAMIGAAVDHVRRQGGTIVEAYPSILKSKKAPPTTSFMGTPEVFRQAGFVECAAPSPAKRIMRYAIAQEKRP